MSDDDCAECGHAWFSHRATGCRVVLSACGYGCCREVCGCQLEDAAPETKPCADPNCLDGYVPAPPDGEPEPCVRCQESAP
jgi:hypothetical protein